MDRSGLRLLHRFAPSNSAVLCSKEGIFEDFRQKSCQKTSGRFSIPRHSCQSVAMYIYDRAERIELRAELFDGQHPLPEAFGTERASLAPTSIGLERKFTLINGN